MPVQDPNKQYEQAVYSWALPRDTCAGAERVKEARNFLNTDTNETGGLQSMAGSLYLPVPNASDDSIENQQRYRDYLRRACFTNYVGHTKDALLGMVFRKKPEIKLANQVKAMEYNADGAGNSLFSVMKRTTNEVLEVGRQGLLLDYPEMQGKELNLANTEGLLPFIKSYCAEAVINWRTDFINGKQQLCLVVLKEKMQVWLDDFTADEEDCYRVLMLNDDGVYIQQRYDNDGKLLFNEDGESDIIPKQSDKKPWGFIPFIFVGSVNNDPDVDRSPLYDLAEVNIAHYRNSADYEESCFLVGQPTPVLAGLSQHWVDEVLDGKVMLGSRAPIPLPVGGSAMLLQANPNQMPLVAMQEKEKQMIQIGAKIITDAGGVETAEAARIRFAGQNSKLGTVVGNIEDAYNTLLNWALLFTGGNGSCEVEFNKDFYERSADPQMVMAQIQMLDRGVIAMKDIRAKMRKVGEIAKDRDDEDIDQDIADENPL